MFTHMAIHIKLMNTKSIIKFHEVSELSVLKKFQLTVFKKIEKFLTLSLLIKLCLVIYVLTLFNRLLLFISNDNIIVK